MQYHIVCLLVYSTSFHLRAVYKNLKIGAGRTKLLGAIGAGRITVFPKFYRSLLES